MSLLNTNHSEENYSTYFPYFNNTLFMTQPEFSKDDDLQVNTISDESSTSISQASINSLEDEEKLIPLNLLDLSPVKNSFSNETKFDLIPKNIFDSFEKEEKQVNDKIKPELQKYILPKELFDNSKCKKKNQLDHLDEKKLKVKPFIPSKYKMENTFLVDYPEDFFHTQSKQFNKFNNNSIQQVFIIKKTKKKFVERKGDWRCSKCNNINFAFRNKCNKCQIEREESEKYLAKSGDKISKINQSPMNFI